MTGWQRFRRHLVCFCIGHMWAPIFGPRSYAVECGRCGKVREAL